MDAFPSPLSPVCVRMFIELESLCIFSYIFYHQHFPSLSSLKGILGT